MAWKQNIIEDFKQLVSFDSISFHERKTADWLLARLKSMGFSVEEDQAGAYYGGDTGNIFAVLDGELEGELERCLPIRKHRGAREKRYSFGYAVFLILALMK